MVRSLLSKAVEDAKLKTLFEAARLAPSGVNTVLCDMALGYENEQDVLNSVRPERVHLSIY